MTVRGLVDELVMEPVQPGNNYFNTSLSNPPFEPGMGIELKTTDGFFGRMTLYGLGVIPLDGLDEQWTITATTALDVSWDPPDQEVRSRVLLKLNIFRFLRSK